MANDLSLDTISVNDIISAYESYEASEEAKETILCFISELTGLSVDAILEMCP